MLLITTVMLGFLYGTVQCDYSCLYIQGSTIVYAKDNITEIGKAQIDDSYQIVQFNDGDNVVALAYKHQIGYIRKDSNVRMETCAGDPRGGDTLTTQATSMQPTTMTKPTTMQQTTTEHTTTMLPGTTAKTTTLIQTKMETSTIQPTTLKTTVQPSTTSSPVPIVNQSVCPQIVQEYARDNNNIIATRGHTCYEVEVHRRGTWSQAESDCKLRGGHLLNVESAEEQNFINGLLSEHSFKYNLWIGLNDRNHEEHFEWASGNNITFMNWLPGRKNTFFLSNEDCVYMSPSHNWQWDDAPCSGFQEIDHRFMCQYRTIESSFIVTTVDPSAGITTFAPQSHDGNTKLCLHHNMNHAKQFGGTLAQYGHSCYEILPRTKYTWNHGESICHSHGGHLAHISSAAEQSFIQGFLTRHFSQHAVWIGLHDQGREGHFEWTSGNPLTYTNWVPGHMDNFASHNQEDCVAFIPYQNGQWDDIQCGSQSVFGGDTGETHPLLCQYSFLYRTVQCDYPCLYVQGSTIVYAQDNITEIGKAQIDDIYPIIQFNDGDNVVALAYKHQIVYIRKDSSVRMETCSGHPDDADALTTQTTTLHPTTTEASTMQQTTTVASTMQPTTTEASSMQPTTTEASTMQPKTMEASTLQPKTMEALTMQPTTTEALTMQPTTTEALTMQPKTTEASTMRPTTMDASTMNPTTTETSTMQSTTTEKATTMKLTTMEKTTTKQLMTAKPTIQPSTTLPPVPTVLKDVCPQVVQEHARDDSNIVATRGHKCYEVMAHRAGPWHDAERDCRSRGGHLLNIASADEQIFINALLIKNSFKYNLWIGLHDLNQEERFQWVSGDWITFTNWMPDRKNTFLHDNQDCVYMSYNNNWKWDDEACYGILETDHRFACQYGTVDPSTVVITTALPYPDGNTKLCLSRNMDHAKQNGGTIAQYGHSCYELLPRTKYTFNHGDASCHNYGGHLAHISSAAEQDFIQGFMTRHSPQHAVWIGLHDRGREGHFEWTSGNSVTYTNWVPGHMDNFVSHNQEDCVVFIPYQNGKWDDIPCGSQELFAGDVGETHPYMCQFNTAVSAIVG